ncbi:hypothetical protein J3458_011702 [Metarhizium acridum]|uniref:uncharacterized protein n=1 Tax=Metarhizium acridum TaxID=92637 RepID=UPI001C6C6254|nr:hypothetical protein J3458_011702 [Metarhizium acridum]
MGIDEGIVFSRRFLACRNYNNTRSPIVVGKQRCLSLVLFQSTCLVRFAAWRSPPNSPNPPDKIDFGLVSFGSLATPHGPWLPIKPPLNSNSDLQEFRQISLWK